MKKKVLIMSACYIPGVKGGGPIQSIKNLVDNLSDRIDFYIVTSDRDLGDDKPFPNIKTDEWLQVGEAKVLYTDVSKLTLNKTAFILNSIDYDVIYLNSFFSYKFSIATILITKFKRISRKPIVLAPRGEFSKGALGLKSKKKKIFIKLMKSMGFYKRILWHATAKSEKKDIEEVFGTEERIKVANNLTANYRDLNYDKNIEKEIGELKIVFISRIHPKKNLKKALEFLKSINGNIEFSIYGPIENKSYWSECERLILGLPKNIKVLYKGVIEHDKIMDIFKVHHVFLFPTLGENFGHVISEAFIGGCPVIISDQTPWRNLEKHEAGWDISLNDEKQYNKVIQFFIDVDQEKYNALSKSAFNYGKMMSNKDTDIQKSYELFTLK